MFCIPFKRRKKKRQCDKGAGDENQSCIQNSLQTNAPSPTATPTSSEAPKKVRKTSWLKLWPFFKKKKCHTCLKKDVVKVASPSPPMAENSIKCTEDLEDGENRDLDGSPASQEDAEFQADQDSKGKETILPCSDKELIVSSLDETSGHSEVLVETSLDGETHALEKETHTVKEDEGDKLLPATSVTEESLKKTRAMPNIELGGQRESSMHPNPASGESKKNKKFKISLRFIKVQLFRDTRVHPIDGAKAAQLRASPGSGTDVSVSFVEHIQQKALPQSDLFITDSNGHNDLEVKTGASAQMDTKIDGEISKVDQAGSAEAESTSPGLSAKVYKLLAKPYSSSKEKVPNEELECLGLPNLGMTCYINSTLQSLLTLSCFVQEIHNQLSVWNSIQKPQIFRGFLDVQVCRFSNVREEKKIVLSSFKKTIAQFNSDFDDGEQKDAHEFLICVLNIMRSMSQELQLTAASLGFTYTCPVEGHFLLQMMNTRTCKGCGQPSQTVEEFVNLSLDLSQGGSVHQCLQNYLKEVQLEYMCHCGVQDSSLQSSFLTLPNLLILHLKRFVFTKSYTIKKMRKCITLSRELVVKEEVTATKDTTGRYSLVGVVSHLGPNADSGHYICDSVYRRQDMGDTAESWLTYDDEHVSQTTGEAVCSRRETTAFLLFYEKQPVKS